MLGLVVLLGRPTGLFRDSLKGLFERYMGSKTKRGIVVLFK